MSTATTSPRGSQDLGQVSYLSASPDEQQVGQEPEHAPKQPLNLYDYVHEDVKFYLMVTGVIVVGLSYLKTNVFLTGVVLWTASYVLLGRLRSSQADIEYSLQRDWAKAKLKSEGCAGSDGVEGVEWINKILATLWPLMTPDIFRPFIDLLEDTLKVLAPGIVTTVRIEDLSQGRNPLQLLGFSILDEQDPWVQNQANHSDNHGGYVNLEAQFSYRHDPGTMKSISNVHFHVYLGIGLQKLASCELPVFVRIDGLHGRIKLRVQLLPVPPFCKDATFSFPTIPEVEITAKPLHGPAGPNLMSLPVFSHFIKSSVNVLLEKFTSPASYTLDLAQILLGDDAIMFPHHIGVAVIIIHSAKELKGTKLGNHDPTTYTSISLTKSGSRPLFVTRTHKRDASPNFEELAFVPITPEQILEADALNLTVCDSERLSEDQPFGKTTVELNHIINKPGRMEFFETELLPVMPDNPSQGSLSWSVGYFGYCSIPAQTFNKASRKIPTSSNSNHGIVMIHIQSLVDLQAQTRKLNHAKAMKIHMEKELQHDERHLPSTYCIILINDVPVFKSRVKKNTSDPYVNSGIEHFLTDFEMTKIDIVVMEIKNREHDSILGIASIKSPLSLSNFHQMTKWWTLRCGNGSGKIRASLVFQPVDIRLDKALCGWSLGTLEIFIIKAYDLGIEDERWWVKLTMDCACVEYHRYTDTESIQSQDGRKRIAWVMKPRVKLPVVSRMQSKLTVQLHKKPAGLKQSKETVDYEPVDIWLSETVDQNLSVFKVQLNEKQTSPKSKSSSVHEDGQKKRIALPHGITQERLFSRPNSQGDSNSQLHDEHTKDDQEHSPILSPVEIAETDRDFITRSPKPSSPNSSTGPPNQIGPTLHISLKFVPGISRAHKRWRNTVTGLRDAYQAYESVIRSDEEPPPKIKIDLKAFEVPMKDKNKETEIEKMNESYDHQEKNISVPDNEPMEKIMNKDKKMISEHVSEVWTDDEFSDDDHDNNGDDQNSIDRENDNNNDNRFKEENLIKNKSSIKTHDRLIGNLSEQISKHVDSVKSKKKTARTIKWMKDSAKIRVTKAKAKMKHMTPVNSAEKETISSF